MPTGESFVRQGLYGQRYLQRSFGVTATVGMNVDPFGHNAMLPQILRGQGMDAYVFLRPGPHEARLSGHPVLVGGAGRLPRARVPDPVRVLQPAAATSPARPRRRSAQLPTGLVRR